MKICLLYNIKKHPEQKELLDCISNSLSKHELVYIDFSKNVPLHSLYFEIEKAFPDTIISLDFSGFELRTEGDDLSLNRLGCRILLLINDDIGKYKSYLNFQLNFSMFLFIDLFANKNDNLVKGRDNIPNYELVKIKNEQGLIDDQNLKATLDRFFELALLK